MLAAGGSPTLGPVQHSDHALSGRCRRAWWSSNTGDVGVEEVDAVAVEVAVGAVVVLGGAWAGVSGEDLTVAEGTPASRALVMAACRSECGLTCRGIPATLAIRST